MKDTNFSFFGMDMISNAMQNKYNKMKVFDWDKAAKIIKENNPKLAEAGLEGDWGYTGGVIYEDGETVDVYTYLMSTWATPALILDGQNSFECWLWEDETEYNAYTKWPESAVQILKGEVQ